MNSLQSWLMEPGCVAGGERTQPKPDLWSWIVAVRMVSPWVYVDGYFYFFIYLLTHLPLIGALRDRPGRSVHSDPALSQAILEVCLKCSKSPGRRNSRRAPGVSMEDLRFQPGAEA